MFAVFGSTIAIFGMTLGMTRGAETFSVILGFVHLSRVNICALLSNGNGQCLLSSNRPFRHREADQGGFCS